MMKRAVGITLATLLMLSLAACNSSGSNQGTAVPSASTVDAEKDNAASDEVVKLVIWGAVPNESGPNQVLESWHALHPNIQVEYIRYVNDDTGITKLDTALLSGEKIDMFFSYYVENVKNRYASGILEDLELFSANEFVESELIGGLDGCVKMDGKL